MQEFRVTKYNPDYRNAQGHYTRDEWTSFHDIGALVTEIDYLKVETCYIDTIIKFLEEQAVFKLTISYLENYFNAEEAGIELKVGTQLNHAKLRIVIKSILRERYWAILESETVFIHFGREYYLYIGVQSRPDLAIRYAESCGLFIEEFSSPYHEDKE